MLIEFFGRNFGCFRDEFRLSMLATDIDPNSDRGIVEVEVEGDEEPLRLLRCAAIYGPNASGKSTVLRSAMALYYLLRASGGFESERPLDPYEPFLLEKKYRSRPVMLGLRAIVARKVYEYIVEFDRKQFLLEELVEVGPVERKVLFRRELQEVIGPWINHRRFSLLSESFRPNSLLLSLADRLAPDLADGLALSFRRLLRHYDSSESTLQSFGGIGEAAGKVRRDAEFGRWILPWLKSADLGIVNYEVKEVEVSLSIEDELEESSIKPNKQRGYALMFTHGGRDGGKSIPYPRESMGTRKLVGLASYIYSLSHGKNSRAYFIDEIGASMHPKMLDSIIRHFNCDLSPEAAKGQLVLTTHETSLMEGEARNAALRRDQVWFTEKASDGASRLYSLVDFRERQNLNMRRRYLQGRYGALPAIETLGE